MDKEQLVIGDVVRFKGSGPAMTILKVGTTEVTCGWFDIEKHYHKEEFPMDSIRKPYTVTSI